VDSVLRGSKKVDVSRRENSNKVRVMASQALKVLDQLSKLQVATKKPKRSIKETSQIAEAKLKSLVDNGVDLQKFYSQYDVNRTGRVSYKDFGATLLACSAGIGRDEAHELAAHLDKGRVGAIDYNNILASLKQIQKAKQPFKQQQQQQKNQQKFGGGPSSRGERLSYADDEPDAASTAYNESETGGPPPLPYYTSLYAGEEKELDKVKPNTSFSYVGNKNKNKSGSGSDSDNASSTYHISPLEEVLYDPSDGSRREYIMIQDLNPGAPSHPLLNNNPQCPKMTEKEARAQIARRFFYNPAINNVIFGDATRSAPYHVEEAEAASSGSRSRSSSAPSRYSSSSSSRGGRGGGTSLRTAAVMAAEEEERNKKNNKNAGGEGVSEAQSSSGSKHKHSMRACLIKLANGEYDGADDDGDGDGNGDNEQKTNSPAASADDLALRAKLEANPFYRADVHRAARQEELAELTSRTVESAVAAQIQGNIHRFRQVLQQHDGSNSGTLNLNEFESALKKAGVDLPAEHCKELYLRCADRKVEPNTHGYSRGTALNIEDFTSRLQARATASTFAHTYADATQQPSAFFQKYGGKRPTGEDAKQLEALRVMKKVLHSSSKLCNPHAVYKDVCSDHNGFLSTDQLKDALGHMGANLSAGEFSVLLEKVPRERDGKVSIQAFEQQLRADVSAHDRATSQSAAAQYTKFKHYCPSFRTSEDFSLAHQQYTEYEPLCHQHGKRAASQVTQRWEQLRDILQQNPDLVARAFGAETPEEQQQHYQDKLANQHLHPSGSSGNSAGAGAGESSHEVSLSEHKPAHNIATRHAVDPNFATECVLDLSKLQRSFAAAGLSLSSDDVKQIDNSIKRETLEITPTSWLNSMGNSVTAASTSNAAAAGTGKVSLGKFCEIVGIPIVTQPSNNSIGNQCGFFLVCLFHFY
jgi:Ca2+-binding EF-hand superfamily protein